MAFTLADPHVFAPVAGYTGAWPRVAQTVGWDHAGTIFSIAVGLDALPGGDAEFYFVLVCADPGGGERPIWSGLDVPPIVSREARAAILSRVLACVDTLLAIRAPPRIFRSVHDAGLPAKARVKHARIGGVFEAHGYRIVDAGIRHGRPAWWAEKLPR